MSWRRALAHCGTLLLGLIAVTLGTPAGAAAAAPLPALHAEPDVVRGGRFVDARGREVLLRGVNVNALVDYWRGGPLPTVFGLERDDPALMASLGWNAVRLLVSWSRIEPEPGRYDDRYLAQVAATVERLEGHGLYSILDLHQDAWGPSLAARSGEACEPPGHPALGWDGAPAWATLDDGLPRCYVGWRDFSPAVRRAWEAFFTDRPAAGGMGVQARYLAMLRHVARRFAREPAVAAIDVMNEPNAIGPEQEAQLSTFYARAVRAVRGGERAGRGSGHVVLVEPSLGWSGRGGGAPPPFPHDGNLAYSPHLYGGGLGELGPPRREAFLTAREEARRLGGLPVLSGEWGAEPDRALPGSDEYFVAHQRLQDEARIGATLWTWRESCGDPHIVLERRLRPELVPRVWGVFEVDCADGRNAILGPRRELLADLARAYVRRAPGRLVRMRYEERTGLLTATGTGARRGVGTLEAFVPASAGRRSLRVRTSGLAEVSTSRHGGAGWVLQAHPRGDHWTLRVAAR